MKIFGVHRPSGTEFSSLRDRKPGDFVPRRGRRATLWVDTVALRTVDFEPCVADRTVRDATAVPPLLQSVIGPICLPIGDYHRTYLSLRFGTFITARVAGRRWRAAESLSRAASAEGRLGTTASLTLHLLQIAAEYSLLPLLFNQYFVGACRYPQRVESPCRKGR